MANPLEIKILAKLDESLSTQEINKQLKSISKNVNINLGIDTKGLNEITKKVDDLQKQVKSKLGGFKIIDADVAQQELNKVDGEFRKLYRSIDEAVNRYKKFGTVKVDTNLDPITKEVQSFNLQIEKGGALVEKLKFDLAQIAGTNQKVFEISKIGLTDKTDVLNEKQLQQEHQIRKKLQDDAEKQIQKEEELNKQIQQQIELFKKASSINVANLQRRYGDALDVDSIKKFTTEVESLSANTPNVSHKMKDLNLDLRNITATARTSTSHILGFGEALRTAFQKFPVWLVAASAIYAPIRALDSGIQTIHNLDDALVDLKKVTNETSDTYAQFALNINNAADSIGASTTDFIKATTEFARMGLNLKQAQASAKQAVVYANVGDFGSDTVTASTDLIATMKAYNLQFDEQGKNLQRIVDLYNNVSNKYSINAQGIGDAMKRSAASLSVAGNSIEQSVALITAANNSIQDPAQVGTALKTVSMRLRGIDDSGNEVVGLLPTLEKKFNDLGISLEDNNGKFKSTFDIMNELADVFNSGKLNDFQKSDILEAVAGKRQGNIIAGLLANIKDMNSALKDGLQSAGSSTQELNNYLDSITAHINKFKNTAVGFWQHSIDSDAIKSFIDVGTGAISVLTSMVKHFGLLKPIIVTTGLSLLLFNKDLKTATMTNGALMIKTLKGMVTGFRELDTSIAATGLKMRLFSGVSKITAVSLNALKVAAVSTFEFLGGAILPIAAVMALTYGIEKLTGYFAKQHQEAQKLKQDEQQLTENYKNHADEITNLADKYRELSQEVDAGARSKNDKEYLQTQQQLSKLLPNVVKSVDAVGNAHLQSSKMVDKEIESLKRLSVLDSQKFIDSFDKKLDQLNNKILSTQSKIKKFNVEVTGTGSNFNTSTGENPVQFKKTALTAQDQENNIMYQRELSASIQQRADLFKQLSSEYQKFLGVENLLTQSDQSYINSIIEKNKANLNDADTQKKVETQIKSVIGSLGELHSVLGSGIDLSSIAESIPSEKLSSLSTLVKSYKSGGETIQQFSDILKANGYTMEQITAITNALTDAKDKNKNKTQEQIDAEATAQQTLQAVLTGTKDVQEILNDAVASSIGLSKEQIDENTKLIEIYSALSQATNLTNEQQQLLKQTYDELIKRFPELVSGHGLNINTLMDEANANNVLYQATVDSANGRLTAEQQLTLKLAQEAKNQIEILKKQVEAHRAAALDMIGIDQKTGQVTGDDGMLRLSNIALKNLRTSEAAQDELNNVAIPKFIQTGKILGEKLNISPTFKTPDWNYDNGNNKKPKGGTPSTADTQAVNKYQTDAFSKSLTDLELQLKQSQARLDDYDKTSVDYRNELNHQLDLIKKEESLTTKQISTLEKRNDALKRQLATMGDYNKLSNKQKQSYNDIAKAIDDNINKIDDLKGAMVDYGQKVQDVQSQVLDSFSAIGDMITNNINTAMQQSDDSYDSQIKKLQEKLDLLDQEYAKEDRNAKLRDIQNQIDTAKADKRFEYINAQGQVELTYDKGKVADLQKQQDDLIQQYNREDAKKAIQDQIDRLQEAKDNQHAIYEQQVQDTKDFWDDLVNGIKDGTISFDDIMNGKDGFYSKSLDALSKYGINVGSLIEAIKSAFVSLGDISVNTPNLGNQEEYLKNLKKNGTSGQSKWANDQLYYLDLYQNGTEGQKAWAKKMLKFHDGGIVSSSPNQMTEIANQFLNSKLQPNEQVIKVLKGELLSPASNIAQNFMPNLRTVMGSIVRQPSIVETGDTFTLNNVTIKANNAEELINSISSYRRSVRT